MDISSLALVKRLDERVAEMSRDGTPSHEFEAGASNGCESILMIDDSPAEDSDVVIIGETTGSVIESMDMYEDNTWEVQSERGVDGASTDSMGSSERALLCLDLLEEEDDEGGFDEEYGSIDEEIDDEGGFDEEYGSVDEEMDDMIDDEDMTPTQEPLAGDVLCDFDEISVSTPATLLDPSDDEAQPGMMTAAANEAHAAATPIVIDIDGDGVESPGVNDSDDADDDHERPLKRRRT